MAAPKKKHVRKAREFDEDGIPPDALVIPSPTTAKAMTEQQMTLRKMAKMLFVTDSKENSVEWHWENDRDLRGAVLFKDHVTFYVFRQWSLTDHWIDSREEFWGHVEVQVLANLRDEFTRAKIDELRIMTESRGYLTEYLFPMKDRATGEVRRHPADHRLAGLPVYPLDLGNMPKLIEAFLKLDERMMLKRGEAISRTQGEIDDIRELAGATDASSTGGPAAALAKRMNFNPDEARTAARLILEQRNAAARAARDGGVIDVESENDGRGEGDDEGAGDEAL